MCCKYDGVAELVDAAYKGSDGNNIILRDEYRVEMMVVLLVSEP